MKIDIAKYAKQTSKQDRLMSKVEKNPGVTLGVLLSSIDTRPEKRPAVVQLIQDAVDAGDIVARPEKRNGKETLKFYLP